MQVHFVKIQKPDHRSALDKLRWNGAAGRTPCLGSVADGSFTVDSVKDDVQALEDLVPSVLKRLLEVTRKVSRARCTIPFDYQEVEDGALVNVEGHAVELSGDNHVVVDKIRIAWDPAQEVLPLNTSNDSTKLPVMVSSQE